MQFLLNFRLTWCRKMLKTIDWAQIRCPIVFFEEVTVVL